MTKKSAVKTGKSKTGSGEAKQDVAKLHETGRVLDARGGKDRRGGERRGKQEPVAEERRELQRRVKVNRRRQIDPTTCERDYTPEEVEFMNAMDLYKRASGRMFPTCSEVLEVFKKLGLREVLAPADRRYGAGQTEMSPALALL